MIHLSQVLFHLLKTNEEIKVEMRLFFHLKNISTRVLVCCLWAYSIFIVSVHE